MKLTDKINYNCKYKYFIDTYVYSFLTKHNIIVFLALAKTVDTGISCAYLRLFSVILKRSVLENACIHLVSYKLGRDTKSIHY